MFDDIFSPLDTINERDRQQRWLQTTVAGRRLMTRTAAGDEENGGGLQTAMVDDIR